MGDKIYAFVFATMITAVFIWDSSRQAKIASYRQDGDKVYASVASAQYGRTDINTVECGSGVSVPVGLLKNATSDITPVLFFPSENTASGIVSYADWYASIIPVNCQNSLATLSGSYAKTRFTENGIFLGEGTGSIFFGSTFVDGSGAIR